MSEDLKQKIRKPRKLKSGDEEGKKLKKSNEKSENQKLKKSGEKTVGKKRKNQSLKNCQIKEMLTNQIKSPHPSNID